MSFLLQILKWEPDYYKNILDLPRHMPKSLRDHIKEVTKNDTAMVSSHFVHCTFIMSIQGSANLLDTKFATKKYRNTQYTRHIKAYVTVTKNT